MARGFSVFVGIGAKLLPSLGGSIGKIEERFGVMNRRLQVQAAETKLRIKEMAGAASPMLTMAAAAGLSFGFEKAIEGSSHLAHELQNLRNAGRGPMEIAQAMTAANKAISALPTTTLIDNLKVLNETTGAFGNFQHAIDNLTFNQRIGSMMQNMLGEAAGSPGEMFNNIVRAMEMRGSAQDAKRYQSEVGQLYRAMIFTRGRVNPQEFFNFAQGANPYIKGYSERYLTKIAPSLIQEFGGDHAGMMSNTWTGTILGKAKNKISTEAWMSLGLLDPKQVVSNKVGPVGWKPGAIKGTDLALRDPLAWSEQVLIPALKAHGFNTSDQLSLAKALMPLFRDRNANRLASVLVGDRDRMRLHKDEGLINRVPDAKAAYNQTLRRDPLMAWAAIRGSFGNLSSVLFGTGRQESPVAIALVHIANGVNMLAETLERHTWAANGIGAALGLSAGMAVLKTFGIALRWAFSPLRLLYGPLRRVGVALADAFGPSIVRGILTVGPRILTAIGGIGGWIMRGLIALAPLVMEGIGAAFALLSNPIGWTILAVAAVTAVGVLIYKFRDSIGPALTRAWGAIKGAFLALPWRDIGLAVGDVLTLGLASRIPAAVGWIKDKISGPSAPGAPAVPAKTAPAKTFRFDKSAGAPKIAGARASGGPVVGGRLYLVGERGPELFRAPVSGSIVSASNTAAMGRRRPREIYPRDRRERPAAGSVTIKGATIVIQDARDPEATARAVKRVLREMGSAQDGLLSD